MSTSDPRDEQIGAAIRAAAAEVSAPPSLRARVAEQRLGVRRRARGRVFAGATLAAGLAAVAVALVLATGGGGPPVTKVAALASSPPPGPAPAAQGDQLRVRVGDVAFPRWHDEGWRATQVTRQVVGGRSTTVVSYAGPRKSRIGYAIVDGSPLDHPANTHPATYRGVTFAVGARGHDTVLSWTRGGHTCVIAARGVPSKRLLALAVWPERS